jgi:hypothetical protein
VIADAKAIVLCIDADVRFAAAAGAIARFLGEAAGLNNEALTELQKSVVAAATEALEHLMGSHPHLNVTVTRFADRIEVALSHQGSAEPAMGLDRVAGLSGGHEGSNVLEGIDRVQFEAGEGQAVTRLTKYVGHAPRIA